MDAPTPAQTADYTHHSNGELSHETKALRAIPGMAGGADELSYTRNSRVQFEVINMLKPIIEQEIGDLKIFHDRQDGSSATVRIADFGCSTGFNTLQYAEICFQSVQDRCRVRARESGSSEAPAVQYFFCDLPSNDFNTLFRQLEDWRNSRTPNLAGASDNGRVKNFYPAGVSGSFYGHLFPPRSLHVAISTFALQWMSQVPDAVMDKASPAYNKGRVWIDRIQNSAVLDAYSQTAQQDLRNLLVARADELVSGGFLLFLVPGRADESRKNYQWCEEAEYSGPYNIVFENTWQELVTEGVIDEETRDSFNVPTYHYSVGEARAAAESTKAFDIKTLEIRQVSFLPPEEVKWILAAPEEYGKFACNFVRALLLPFMVEHLGEQRTAEFFHRFERNAAAAAREKRISNLSMDVLLAVLLRLKIA